MRKVLVLGAAVVAACASAATTVHEGAAATRGEPVATATSGSQIETAEGLIVTLPPLRKRTYSYGPDEAQRVDAYWRDPQQGAVQPAVLLLHGGYWLEGTRTSWGGIARRLADRGYAVFSADYRLSETAPWPAQRDDAEAALSFLKRHASTFGVDPDRIVVVGSSAGGQLATMLGTYGSGAQRVRGVVALSPVNSPYLGFVDGGLPDAGAATVKLREAVSELIGCVPVVQGDPLCWQRLEDAAPATHAGAGDAPMLITHSAREFVPAAHSTQLATTLKSHGVPVTVTVVPGATHGMSVLRQPQIWDKMVTWIDSVTHHTPTPTSTP